MRERFTLEFWVSARRRFQCLNSLPSQEFLRRVAAFIGAKRSALREAQS